MRKLVGALLLASAAASPALALDRNSLIEQLDRTHTEIDPRRHVNSYGEIESIDVDQGTVTLQHVPLESPDKSIWMPVMRMVFHVTNRRKLNGLKPGDWVTFEAVRMRNALMVTNIRKFPLEGSRSTWYEY
jgi:Cu/Ag efflux protein CusF